MKLKEWALVGVSLALVGMLVACGGKQANSQSEKGKDGRIKLTYINGFTGGDGAYMKKITSEFNESQDKYEVEEIQDKDHYTKFKTGNYDLVVIHGNNIETYKRDKLIQPVNELLDKANVSIDDFHPAGKEIVDFDGDFYGIPLDIHPLTMMYNKDLVKEAPKDYDDLVSLNSQLQEKGSDLYALGVPSLGLVEFYMMTIAAQENISLEKDGYLNFAQDSFADALMIFHNMVWKDKISPANLGLDGEFQSFMKENETDKSVQSAVALTGPWFYGAAKEKYEDKLGLGMVPQLGKTQAVYGNSHTLGLPASVKDDEKLEGLAEFIRFMYTPENLVNWAESGQAPAHLPTMNLIEEDKDKYPLSYQNQQQFDTFVPGPQVYQFGEQIRYMNETVFSKLITNKDLTKNQLMKELEKATEKAKQISGN